ncbi:MAG: ATP-binding protein [Candidatus Moraniibacteriota bacterium]
MICPSFANPQWFFFASGVPQLLYYSHFPSAVIAVWLGAYVYFKNPKFLAARILLAISIVFLLWILCDLVTWTNNNSSVIIFAWSFFGIFYATLSLLSVYFTYVFLDGRDISLTKKLIFLGILLPIIVLTPTKYNVDTFFLNACGISDGGLFFTNYYYGVGFVAFLWILGLIFVRARRASAEDRKKTLLFGFGIEFFLLSFFVSGFLASFLVSKGYIQNFGLEFFGLFGMVIFMTFLTYLIVRYHAFNIRLLGAQALVTALGFLVGSQLFYVKNPTNFVLTQVSLVLIIVAGFILIRSVKEGVKRQEQLQKMTDALAIANEKLRKLDTAKSEFISIASHQLRTPLTAIKGFISLILEGVYGPPPPKIEDALNKVYSSNERLVHLVEDLLNLSRIESGRLEYHIEPTPIEDVLKELYALFRIITKQKGLAFEMNLPKKPLPLAMIDMSKLREVLSNVIDNAIKYTKEGGVTIKTELLAEKKKIQVRVTDTGIGVPPDEMHNLFQKFSRGKDTSRLHANGTGLGLYVGKQMIEAMGGKIWVASKGDGLGSTFIVEVPVA